MPDPCIFFLRNIWDLWFIRHKIVRNMSRSEAYSFTILFAKNMFWKWNFKFHFQNMLFNSKIFCKPCLFLLIKHKIWDLHLQKAFFAFLMGFQTSTHSLTKRIFRQCALSSMPIISTECNNVYPQIKRLTLGWIVDLWVLNRII